MSLPEVGSEWDYIENGRLYYTIEVLSVHENKEVGVLCKYVYYYVPTIPPHTLEYFNESDFKFMPLVLSKVQIVQEDLTKLLE